MNDKSRSLKQTVIIIIGETEEVYLIIVYTK